MKNTNLSKILCLVFVVILATIAFNVQKTFASDCSVRIVNPQDGDYVESGKSLSVKIFIDCAYAYKVDYSLNTVASNYKQTSDFRGVIDYGNVTLPDYSASNVTAALKNYTNDTIAFAVTLYKCVSPSNYTSGTCNSWEGTSDYIRLKVKKATVPSDPLTVACYATPAPAKVGDNVKIYAYVSGGTSPLSYSWSGDVVGSSKDVYKTFNTKGTYNFSVSVTDSNNQTKTGKCALSVEDTYTPPTPDKYTCNRSTYNCTVSSLGEYSSKSSCQLECQPTPQPNRYTCNRSTNSCSVSSYGEYTSYSACTNDCYTPPTPNRYTCNRSTNSCSVSSYGEYTSYSACTNDCYTPPTPSRYTCNRSASSCSVSSLGEYSSYTACADECKAEQPLPRYSCNMSTNSCSVSNLGEYSSYTECFYTCQPKETKYSCNQNTHQCSVDQNGTYTNLNTCNNSCNVQLPTVDITVNPSIIDRGQTAVLSWTSNNATTCIASNGWSGNKAISGSENTSPTNTTTFTITCSNSYGSASDSTTLTVRDNQPSVDLSVYPSTIYRGQSSVLSWTSNNVSSCTATGGWSGYKANYGTETTSPTITTTYYINCIGTNGATVSDSVIVNVIDQQSSNILSITKLGRNLSNGVPNYSKVINVKKGDVIEFYLLVSNVSNNQNSYNTIVLDRLPSDLSYYANTTKIDNISNVDGIANGGLNIGTLTNGQRRVITFQAIANQPGTYYTSTNVAEIRADNVSAVSDSATISYSYVLGASDIATGPADTMILLGGISVAITSSAWVVLNKTEKGKKFLKDYNDRKLQNKINDLIK